MNDYLTRKTAIYELYPTPLTSYGNNKQIMQEILDWSMGAGTSLSCTAYPTGLLVELDDKIETAFVLRFNQHKLKRIA